MWRGQSAGAKGHVTVSRDWPARSGSVFSPHMIASRDHAERAGSVLAL